MKWFRRTKEPYIFSVTPLIDIMFLLLLFYMLTSTFSQKEAVKIALPAVAKSEKVKDASFVVVAISSSGEYFLKDKKIPYSTLKERLSSIKNNPLILIKADAKAPVQSLAALLSILKENRQKKISLEVKPLKK